VTAWYAGQEGTPINAIRPPDDEHCDARNV